MAEIRGRPLFIPLKSEYYADFASGMKTREYRLYGPRWNERTCRPGRPVTLSRGYGTRDRLHGTIAGFDWPPLACLETHVMRELVALFGEMSWHTKIACIDIDLTSGGNVIDTDCS